MMRKVWGVFAMIFGLVGGLVLGTILNDGIVLNVQKGSEKGSMIAVLDRDDNNLTGPIGVLRIEYKVKGGNSDEESIGSVCDDIWIGRRIGSRYDFERWYCSQRSEGQ